MKKTKVGLLALCMAFLLMPFATTAQDGDGKGISGSADNGVRNATAVRSGRSAALPELLNIRQQNQDAGILVTGNPGAINDHQVPDFLKIAPAPANTPGATDTVQANSGVASVRAPNALLSIPGYSNDSNASVGEPRITPPDTNGDVGLQHYVQYVNLGWIVYNKSDGSVAAGPFPGNTFWQGFGGVCETLNAGDPIVLYDHLAGRWFFSQFTGTSVPDGHQCVAISDGEDPTGPYTLYDFVVSPGGFNDYPHIGMWPDGYYMTTHEFSNPGLTFQGTNLTIFDRDEMLAGNPNAGFVQFSSSTSGDDLEFGTMPAHLEGPPPPAGSCHYSVHSTDAEAFGVPGSDRIRVWETCVNFNNPGSSTLNQVNSINLPAFDINLCGFSRDCIDQPGSQLLDPNAANTQYRFNTRYFAGEGVLKGVVTRNIDVGGDRAGVLWAGIDINPINDATSLSDGGDLLGVIDFNDGLNRWMGSASLDQDGNVGIGYTRSSSGSFPSIYLTVHERGVDAPGTVQQESVCVDGSGSHTGANRWADYASTSVDPSDSCTFWHTNEYVETTGNFNWTTRVCSFRIPGCGGGGPVNQPPNASFTFNCTDLSCSFNGNGSSDSDGSIVSFAWSFGDGSNGSGATTSNTYGNAGTFNVTLTVTDDDGATDSQTQSVTVTEPQPSNCPAGSIDFNNFATTAFATQDAGTGALNVLDGGDTFQMISNRWRASTQTFTLTPNTVVEFDFASNSEGEIHGIGMDEDNVLTGGQVFRVFGTQTFGNTITPQYSGGGAFQSYSIPVGQTVTGSGFSLVFVNDKDAGAQDNESRFRCVRVFENAPANEPPVASFTPSCTDLSCSFDGNGSSDSDGSIVDFAWSFGDGANASGATTSHTYGSAGTFNVTLTVTDDDGATDSQTQSVTVTDPPTGGNCPAGSIDFNNFGTTAFATQDAGTGPLNVLDGGDTFQMISNRWRASTQTFTLTANTVVEFDFASDSQGEIHGIAMDDDNTLTGGLVQRVFGTQGFGNTVTPQYTGNGAFQSYSIPVGQFATGGGFRLVFVNDKDAGAQDNESRFRCVRVFEDTPPPGQCSLEEDFENGAAGWTNGAAATCTTGDFVLGTPTQQTGSGVITQVGGDNTTGSGSALFTATNTSLGNADVDGGNCILLSPVFTVSEASTLEAFYFHGQRDGGDDPGDDFFALEVSTNGGSTFTPIVSIGDTETNAAWTPATAAIPAGSQVQIRMQASDGAGPGDIVEAGIDDVSICSN